MLESLALLTPLTTQLAPITLARIVLSDSTTARQSRHPSACLWRSGPTSLQSLQPSAAPVKPALVTAMALESQTQTTLMSLSE